MATVNIDTSGFEKYLRAIADDLRNSDNLLRPLCIELTGIMHARIHEDGQASDGGQIGTYKTSYLKMREAYNHPRSEQNVVLVLTRKLQNSWGPKAADYGTSKTSRGYAIGFVDSGAEKGVTSLNKIQYAEEHFGKKIGDFTKFESEYVVDRLGELTQEIINGRT